MQIKAIRCSLGVSPYAYNSSNELTSTPSATYTYDNNGNTLTKGTSSGTTQYTWDFENRLTSTVLPGSGGTVSFKYDPLGRRIQKTSSAGTTNYVYDGANVLEEVDGSGNVLARYIQSPAVDQPLAEVRGSTTSYYQADGLGSITSLSNSSAALANTYSYDSYGSLTASSGTVVNPDRYTAREFDTETGIYYYRARYYDPQIGRLVTEDPLRFAAGPRYYAYVHNNPLIFGDPSGLKVQIVGDSNTIEELQEAAYNSVNSTPWGHQLINMLEQSPILYIITNQKSGQSYYDPLTYTISVDPNFHPPTAVDNGKTCAVEPAPTNAMLGHEIGHAATGIGDDGPGNMNNVKANENRIREQLGLPIRVAY